VLYLVVNLAAVRAMRVLERRVRVPGFIAGTGDAHSA
jgi:hypothetical protein